MWFRGWVAWCGVLAVALFVLVAFHAGGRTASATHLCGNTGSPKGAFNLQSYEHSNWRLTYSRTFALAGYNRLFSGLSGFALPRLETGGRSAGSNQLADPYIPPRVLKAIAWIESSWAQADSSVPYGEIGPVLVSHDCGYGLMQVTSGMQNTTGIPKLDQAMIGGHYAFNMTRGARILAQKWNLAPEYRPIVGQRDRNKVENWYYALWSYNGFTFKNHPLNPAYPLPRSVYRCDGSQSRSNYPYQELVYGCMNNPPKVDGQALWNPLSATLPNFSDPAFNLSNWNSCSAGAGCAGMDFATPGPAHTDSAYTSLTRAQVIGSPNISASPGNISISAVHGDKSKQVSLTISNPGSGLLSVQVTPSKSWLTVSRRQGVALGSDLGAENLKFTVGGVATSISAGTHTATVKVKSLYPSKTVTVNVTFRVFKIPDGTVLSDSSTRWLMRGGHKRLIPNQLTFEVNGFDSQDVVRVPSSLPSTIPTASPLLNALDDGNIFKGSGATHYVTEGGLKRAIPTSSIFAGCGYGLDAVRKISDATLDSVPGGAILSGPPCPKLSPPSETLIKGSDTKVYAMKGGLKRHIPNPITLIAEGYRWADLNRIPDSSLTAIPTGDSVLNALDDGNILSDSGGTRFVIDGSLRRKIVSSQVFSDCGYTEDAVRTVPDAKLDAIPAGPQLSGSPCPQLSPPGGNLVRGSGGAVYVMRAGLKRHVPNTHTFSVDGFRWGNVNRIPESTLDAIPTGDPLLDILADGNILKGSGATHYVMEAGLKRAIPSSSVFNSCGYGWGAVRAIPDAKLDTIAQGALLAGPPCPQLSPPDGYLVRGSGSAVYVMRGGLKRHIPNTHTFGAEGFRWGNVNRIADSPLSAIPTGDPLLDILADGNILKGSGATHYVMDGGLRRAIPSTEVFNICGYGWGAVHTLSDTKLKSIPRDSMLGGPPCPQLSPPGGYLIRGSEPAIYVMRNGLKRHIVSTAVFSSCGYLSGNVNRIADSTLNSISTGEDVTSTPCP